MTGAEFVEFVRELERAAARAGLPRGSVEIAEGAMGAGIRAPDGSWFTVEREHLNGIGGSAQEVATAVYAVYEEDTAWDLTIADNDAPITGIDREF